MAVSFEFGCWLLIMKFPAALATDTNPGLGFRRFSKALVPETVDATADGLPA
jgi:hypothetical protein